MLHFCDIIMTIRLFDLIESNLGTYISFHFFVLGDVIALWSVHKV